MPKILLLILLTISFRLHAQDYDHCPVNFNADSLRLAAADTKAWAGKIIAFNGVIKEKYRAHGDHRYLLVALSATENIWVGTIMNDDPKIIYEGAHVRMLGYFDIVDDKMAGELNKTGYHVLAFAVVNRDTKKMTLHEGGKKQVEYWVSGKMPVPRID